ncbi:hypothetical protein [Vitiosangium sp. GDMCC 1.1324]|uniref:hypothetical protein n=1 Tax=Vitiosangium sp. (strain GDMCC 1.1324) TaxID=2138576 RepID=UPI000D3C6A2B|nr:hypothetical protein [Vitiosangium sp. GDMCC 1.1324]PTL83083.1 hypothetical protein DAT35_13800 [Vitiosangium sp. GDMCC 1.1324]
MSEPIDPKNPKPLTRREILESGEYERDFMGRPEVRTTVAEPLPDIEETSYHDVLVREVPTEGLSLKHRAFAIAAFTMVLLSISTYFAPGFNGLLAGAFGGFFAKRWRPALQAAVFASVAVPAFFAFLYAWDTPDMLYLFYGLGFWGWSVLHAVCVFIGAAAGVYSRPEEDRLGIRREVMAG